MKYLLLLSLLFMGCSSDQKITETYYITIGNQSGLVKCSKYEMTYCGIQLDDCDTGNGYYCLNNVVKLK